MRLDRLVAGMLEKRHNQVTRAGGVFRGFHRHVPICHAQLEPALVVRGKQAVLVSAFAQPRWSERLVRQKESDATSVYRITARSSSMSRDSQRAASCRRFCETSTMLP